jgi:hypothetical protein
LCNALLQHRAAFYFLHFVREIAYRTLGMNPPPVNRRVGITHLNIVYHILHFLYIPIRRPFGYLSRRSLIHQRNHSFPSSLQARSGTYHNRKRSSCRRFLCILLPARTASCRRIRYISLLSGRCTNSCLQNTFLVGLCLQQQRDTIRCSSSSTGPVIRTLFGLFRNRQAVQHLSFLPRVRKLKRPRQLKANFYYYKS